MNDADGAEFWEVHELEFYWDSHWALAEIDRQGRVGDRYVDSCC